MFLDSAPSTEANFIATAIETSSERPMEAEIGASLGSNVFENFLPDAFDNTQRPSLIFATPPMQKAHFCMSRGYENVSKFYISVT